MQSKPESTSVERLRNLLQRNRRSNSGGVYAVCSAHPLVIETAIRQATEDGFILDMESTSNQVNQEGGYTGQTPQEFADFIHSAAKRAGLSSEHIVLGGDHLGPFPWRNQNSCIAMEQGSALVRACVLAGYQKIHLDASMPCADDLNNPLEADVIAQRAAVLAEAAEKAFTELPSGSDLPVYVIGAEVPAPGGETETAAAPAVTTSEHVQSTLETFRSAFTEHGLFDAWQRVIALVVQPGVEFGNDVVLAYDREKARELSAALPANQPIVYEAHSTDYQPVRALHQMVEDHFAILKVGPWLTFAFREAVFALSAIECELLKGSKSVRVSEVRAALERVMLRNPSQWRSYYQGGEAKMRVSRAYSYSDRCRYFWHEAEVQEEIQRLLANLENEPLPQGLISQYLPFEYDAMRAGRIFRPGELIRHHIQAVLRKYAKACDIRTTARLAVEDADGVRASRHRSIFDGKPTAPDGKFP